MTAADFFISLEHRVTRELAGMRRPELRCWWCDGFLPEKFVVTGGGCHVSGKVWFDDGRGAQFLWNSVVLLGSSLKMFEGLDWAALIPAEDVTGWLSMDFERKFLKIKSYVTIPDQDPAARQDAGESR